jgi:hypothetical protein
VCVWLVVANTAALSYTVGTAMFSFTDVSVQIGVSQIGANMKVFFVPVIVASCVTSATHVLAILCSASLCRRLITGATHAYSRRMRMKRTHPAITAVVPAVLRGAGARLTSSKTRTTTFSSRYSAEQCLHAS